MTERLRVGTRKSPLALAQTEIVLRTLRRVDPRIRYEVVPLTTSGDRTRRSRSSLDFTDEVDRRLERGEVDLAVHSAKDLPASPTRSVRVVAFPRRADPRDCLVLATRGTFRSLRPRARLGSSSRRRQAQLLAARPDLEIVPLRGNIGTRIERIASERLDGVVLAAAGLLRLGLRHRISQYLPASVCLPAPGQGAIAVEAREGDTVASRAAGVVDHPRTRVAVEAERALVRALGGDCDLPLGVSSRFRGDRLVLRAVLFTSDGHACRAERSGALVEREQVAERLARALDAARDLATRSAGSPPRQ